MNDLTLRIPQWLAACMEYDANNADRTTAPIDDALDRHPDKLGEIAGFIGFRVVPAAAVLVADCDFDVVPLPVVLERKVLPIRFDGQLYLVMAQPGDLAMRNWVSFLCAGNGAVPAMTAPEAVHRRLRMIGEKERAIDQFQQETQTLEPDDVNEISLSSIARDQSPVVRLLNSTLFDGLHARASDIHLESVDHGLVVKYRIDGVLQKMTDIQGRDFAEQVISRIKVLGGMDIGERRIPQDGRFQAHIQSRNIDFRVSVMPSIHGEDAVLRILDKSGQMQAIRLETLGFDDATLTMMRALVTIPHGMVLVTGPTGSGKSTTLYATLTELNNGQEKLITIEDPVEYQLPGVLQIPVNDKKGLSFAKGLRSILRHDPDVILVGEIRDAETAGIAVQAALTGHLVLSSVHANGVFSVLERFLYMDVELASLLEALNGVVAQRLVRQNCRHCARPLTPQEIKREIDRGLPASIARLPSASLMAGAGCEACRMTGFHGRIALAEILRCSDVFKEAANRKASTRELKEIAAAEGFVSMADIALHMVARGKTTYQEVQRVISFA